MTCKCLAPDWLTALSVTVIPIQLYGERERERERERATGLLVGFWLIEYVEELPRGTMSGGPCPDRRAPAELPDSGGALPWAQGLNTIQRPVHGSRDARRPRGTAEHRGGFSFCIQSPCPRECTGQSLGARPGHGRRRTATAGTGCRALHPGAQLRLPDSRDALPQARRLNLERRAASGHRVRGTVAEC